MKTTAVFEHIQNWLQSYLTNANAKGFVIGVSGGIDSALTSTLCAHTQASVLCLEMPIHQGKNQVSRASEHIDWLQSEFPNVSRIEVPLTDLYDNFVNLLPEALEKDRQNLALANTRARFRMSTLYYFAGLNNYLVAGTGNKVEDFGVGFYTKYGDGGVDLSPIADLLKTEIYELAASLGVQKSILEAPPTDGLWGDHRTDEDQIGATYPELEWAMQMHEENKVSSDFEGRQREVYEIYTRFHNSNKHKMLPIPVCEIPDELK
ncbi:MAG: NAD(+) synthase [Flavobacteriaceae bacterium]|nr:NAD(+) synthase [Flavobacteriaceae bacterium]OUX39731.1 MAG: NAD(+) synthase [Flavobacteriaceae bacterium TMED265]